MHDIGLGQVRGPHTITELVGINISHYNILLINKKYIEYELQIHSKSLSARCPSLMII